MPDCEIDCADLAEKAPAIVAELFLRRFVGNFVAGLPCNGCLWGHSLFHLGCLALLLYLSQVSFARAQELNGPTEGSTVSAFESGLFLGGRGGGGGLFNLHGGPTALK